MGSAVTSSRPGRTGSGSGQTGGFTLLEILIALILLIVILLTLAPVLAGLLVLHREADRRWGSSLELWNQVQAIRAGRSGEEPERLQILEDGAWLNRYRVSAPSGGGAEWEVLDASRAWSHPD